MALGALDIIIAADTAQLRKGMDTAVGIMQSSGKKMDDHAKNANKSLDSLSSGMRNLTDNVKSLASAYASLSTIKAFIETGFKYNKVMEQQIAGMQRMIVATSQDISAKGKQLSLMEKYNLAGREAKVTMSELEKINAQTPHTLTQTIQIYNAMYASMKKKGVADREMIQLTKEISMATSNLDFGAVLAGVDGLATGTVEVSSDFGRFLGSLGLTNAELKKAGDVAKLVHDRLGQMTLSADSMDEAVSNMTNSWEKFSGKAAEPLFDFIKEDIKSMTKAMDENNQALLDFVYFLSLPLAGVHLLVNAFRVAFTTVPIYFQDAGLAIKEYWIKLLYEIQKSARDVLPEKMAGLLGFDSKSIKDNKATLAAIAADRSTLAAKVIKEQELLYKTAEAYNNINIPKKSDTKSDGDSLVANPQGLSEEEIRALQEYAKNYKSLQDAIFNINATDHDKAIKAIEDQAKLYRDQKLPEVEIAKYVSDAKSALDRKELDELGKMMTESRKKKEDEYAKEEQADRERYAKQIESAQSMYSSLNELSGNWYDNELVNISNRAAEFASAGLSDIEITQWVRSSIIGIDKKRYDEQSELAKKQWEEQNSGWISFFDDFQKAMDNQLFDAMVGKWNSFGDWLKDFWSSLTTSIARAVSAQMSDALIGGIRNMLIGSPSGISTASLFGLGGSFVGSTLSAADIASLGGMSGQSFATSGGTLIDQSGTIVSAGSDISSIVSTASSLKTAYTALNGSLSEMIATGASNLGMNVAGLIGGQTGIGIGTGIGNFGYGLANPWSSGLYGAAGAGSLLSGAAIGGLGGYALGSLGDKLFGADTKAGSYGAIGGAIGSLAGPIGTVVGSVLGSVVGGLFGSTKVKDSGISFAESTGAGAGFDSIQSYIDKKKKSWFSSKSWSEYSGLSSSEIKKIEGIFDAYDYLLAQLGKTEQVIIEAGKYTGQTFGDEIAKNFIAIYTGATDDAIYEAWSEYAESVDKTVMDALTESVNSYISSKRDFEVWALKRSGDDIEVLRKQAEWSARDFENLAKVMDTTGVNVENFADRYAQAIQDSFDPTTISQWESLGEALMSATDAVDAYNKILTDQVSTLQSQYSTIGDTLGKVQYSIGSIVDRINGISPASYEDYIAKAYGTSDVGTMVQTIGEAYDYEYGKIKEKYDLEFSNLKTMKDAAESLREYSANLLYENRSTAIPNQYALRYLEKAISAFQGGDASALDSIKTYSADYIDYLKATSKSDSDYNFGIATMAAKLKGVSTTTENTTDKAIAQLDSTFASSVGTLQNKALAALGGINDAVERQITAAELIVNSNDYQTQQIIMALSNLGLTIDSTWTPEGTLDQYTQIIGMYLDKGIIASQITTDGIDYWVGEMSKFSTDAIGSMIDSIIAEQSAMAAVTDAVTQVASASESGLTGISDSVAGLTDSTLASIDGVSGAVDSLTDTTLSGLSSLTGVIDGLSSSNSVIGADVTTSIGSITGAVGALSNSTASALSGYSETTASGLESITGAVDSASIASTTGTQTLAGLLAGMATAGHTSDLFASLNAVTNAMGSGLSQRISAQTGSITAMDDSIGDSFDDLISSITGDTRSMASAMVSAIGLSTDSIITKMLAANNMVYSAENLQTDAITTQTNTLAAAINLQTSTLSGVIRSSNSNMTVADYINSLYEQGLGRKADSAGYQYWLEEISSGRLAIGDLLKTFSYAAKVNGATFDSANIKLSPASSGENTANLNLMKELVDTVKTLSLRTESIQAENLKIRKLLDKQGAAEGWA